MNTLKFTTNIKCSGCLAKVTSGLNDLVGENNWKVNLEDPKRILTVESNKSEGEIIAKIKVAGFVAESLVDV